ncbi:uncharacterized protein LOC132601284 [Lycium barbarum]|uniref:uncharacterized protein LOC132601284 n=1 Tax=Lycium barbarum TaxID=112863 RepID=UPI00293F0233|nr:uncharacterized protein LOC132601284 [Lycium barbarum]
MAINLVVEGFTLNIISAYAQQAGLDEEEKKRFWEDLDEVMGGIPPTEKLFIGEDFNGHIGSTSGGYDEEHGGFVLGVRNGGGVSLLDFAKAFGLAVANSRFPKREQHLEELDLVKADATGLAERNRLLESETALYKERMRTFDEKAEKRAQMYENLKTELAEAVNANDALKVELETATRRQDALEENRGVLL